METSPQSDVPTTPPTASLVPEPHPTMPPQRNPRNFARLFLVLLLLMLFGSLGLNFLLVRSTLTSFNLDTKVREKYVSHQQESDNKVAIISVQGTILTGEGFVKRQIDRAMKDPSVKAVVLRVNSPGGTITGSDYIYHHLCKLAKEKGDGGIPIVVSMGGLAASGGYYVSMAVGDTPDSIYAEPTTWTGSIGVVVPHYNVAGLMEDWGIEEDSVASGRLKRMGSLSKPIEGEQLEVFEQLVDEGFTRFKDVIKEGRPAYRGVNSTILDDLATGQIYTATQAQSNGLIDKIGFIEDAIGRAIILAKLDPDDVAVVRYEREATLASVVLGVRSDERSSELATLLEMAVPRAYYLCTWLPPLAP